MSKAYDSRIEKVIARVSRQEIQKGMEKLVYRQYLFGTYNMTTNAFQYPGTRVSYSGLIQPLARIQMMDNAVTNAPVVVPPSAQPYQTPPTYVNPGTQLIAKKGSLDGFRVGSWIKVHGISLQIRVIQEQLDLAPLIPAYEAATLYWTLKSCWYPGSDLPNAAPSADEMCAVPRFGYNSKLDTVEATEEFQLRKRNHANGKIKLNISQFKTNEAFIFRYVDLSDKPLLIQYADADQVGAEVIRFKPFLTLRSNIPNAAANSIYMPMIWANTKVHYTTDG